MICATLVQYGLFISPEGLRHRYSTDDGTSIVLDFGDDEHLENAAAPERS